MSSADKHVSVEEKRLQVSPAMSLYYRVYGARGDLTPLVCLPGYWRNSRDFEELAEHVAQGRQVVTADLRGRGQSDRSDDAADYAFDRLRGDVDQLLEAERIDRAVFCGTALGAHLALVLAATDPARVAGIVLNDSGVEAASSGATARMVSFAGADALSFDEVVDRTRAQYAAQFPAFGDAEWVRIAKRAYRQREDGLWERDFDQRTNAMFADLKAAHPDFWPEFKAITDIPVAILRGEHSEYLTTDVAERMMTAHPRARLYTILGSGHAPTLWEPQALEAVDDMLATVDASEAARRG